MRERLIRFSIPAIGLAVALHCPVALGQSRASEDPLSVRPSQRIHSAIDDMQRVALPGNHPAMARPELATGVVSPETRLERMILVLSPGREQKKALASLLDAQQDPSSPEYHDWLTPEEFGLRFGVDDADLEQVMGWLADHGFTIETITSSRNSLVFSGSAKQVQAAFQTAMNRYQVRGKTHLANANDPEIPAVLAGIVEGVVSLHDFRTQPLHTARKVDPRYTNAGGHYLSPADFATIYDLDPLYQQFEDGSGQTIAVVGRSNLALSDVRQFRSAFGLPARDPIVLLNGPDPGTTVSGDLNEATLDVEWAGAVAKNASIELVTSASTNVTDGVYLSAQFIVDHNLAPILSMSYGLCESSLGSAENTFLNNLWQQAAAEGITVVVSSGDSGAAGCDSVDSTFAISGLAVNGLCSTPSSTCVGGTQFDDTETGSLYWNVVNDASGSSARSYIPERAWNESGGSGLWSTGGGASNIYAKPYWQTSAGVPADARRDVPDVSLAAAGHTAYLVFVNGSKYGFSGTSAAAPAFAGLMAVVNQSTRARQGNANPVLYRLAAEQQAGTAPAVFHDVVSGNNSVPGLSGFQASADYDQATGLGSVDAFELVTHWKDSKAAPAVTLSLSTSTLNLIAGSTAGMTVTTSVTGGFDFPITFSLSDLPTGMNASFSPATLPAPGAGTTVLHFTSSTLAMPGTFTVIVTVSTSGGTRSVALALTVLPAPDFSIGASATSIGIESGGQGSSRIVITGNSTFSASVQLAVTGMPAGMFFNFAPAVLAAPGTGGSTVCFSASPRVAPGVYSINVTGAGAGISHSIALRVQVSSFSLSVSNTTIVLSPGGTGSLEFSIAGQGGFHTPVSLALAGLPAGVTYSLYPASVVVAKGSTGSLIFAASATAPLGSRSLLLTAYADGVSKSMALSVNVVGTFSLSGPPAITLLTRGSSLSQEISTLDMPSFHSAVSLKLSGLPAGVTASFSPPSIPNPGIGSSQLTLSTSRFARPGTYACTLIARGSSTAKTLRLKLTVQ